MKDKLFWKLLLVLNQKLYDDEVIDYCLYQKALNEIIKNQGDINGFIKD